MVSRILWIALGSPLDVFTFSEGVYRRDFEKGVIIVAADRDSHVTFDALYTDIVSGEMGLHFIVPKGDAGIFQRVDEP